MNSATSLDSDDMWGSSDEDPPKMAQAPQRPTNHPSPQNHAPQRQPPPPMQAPPQRQPPPPMQAPPDRRRQVRFVDEPRRFARVDSVSVGSSSWFETNKVGIVVVTGLVILILVISLVVVSRRNQTPHPLTGGGPPTYVGGRPGWGESVSQFGAPQYY